MVCCGLSGKSVQSLLGLTLVLTLTVGLGGPAAAAALGLAAFGPRGRHWARTAGAMWVVAVGRLCEDVAENVRVLLLRTRCRLAGRLFRLSPRLSGLVYKHFGSLAGGLVLLAIAAVVVFFAVR